MAEENNFSEDLENTLQDNMNDDLIPIDNMLDDKDDLDPTPDTEKKISNISYCISEKTFGIIEISTYENIYVKYSCTRQIFNKSTEYENLNFKCLRVLYSSTPSLVISLRCA